MASAWVQAWQNNSSAAVTTLTVTIGTGATANNLLFACVGLQDNPGAITTPTGWTLRQSHDSGTVASGAYYDRIASGTAADDFVLTWTTGVEVAITISEYSGLNATAPNEASNENITYVSSDQTAGAAINSSAATAVEAAGRAISGIGNPDSRDGAETEITPGGGFALNSEEQAGTGNTPSAFIGSLAYASAGSKNTDWSSSVGAAWKSYAFIGVYKDAGGGGGGGRIMSSLAGLGGLAGHGGIAGIGGGLAA